MAQGPKIDSKWVPTFMIFCACVWRICCSFCVVLCWDFFSARPAHSYFVTFQPRRAVPKTELFELFFGIIFSEKVGPEKGTSKKHVWIFTWAPGGTQCDFWVPHGVPIWRQNLGKIRLWMNAWAFEIPRWPQDGPRSQNWFSVPKLTIFVVFFIDLLFLLCCDLRS